MLTGQADEIRELARSHRAPLQVRHQRVQLIELRNLRQQVRDVRIPPGQQFPQPGVRHTQPSDHLIGRSSLTAVPALDEWLAPFRERPGEIKLPSALPSARKRGGQ